MKKNTNIEYEMFQGAKPDLFEKARRLRKELTDAESILWEHLRNRKLNGLKFRWQHPVYEFIADFYCDKTKLVIEIDGGYHQEEYQTERDIGRTAELENRGLSVIRFTNEEIEQNIEKVIEKIKMSINK